MPDAPNIIGIVLGAASFIISVFVGIVVARSAEDRRIAREELKEIARRIEEHDRHRTEAAGGAALAADTRSRLTAVEKKTGELAEAAAEARGASSATIVGHSVDNKMDLLVDNVRALVHAMAPVATFYERRTTPPRGTGAPPLPRLPAAAALPREEGPPRPAPRGRLPSRGGGE